MPAIVMRDLHWRYEHAPEFALRGADLEVEEGTFLGVIGPNEAGKTTLVSCIKGLIPHSAHGVYRGSLLVFGREVREKNALELAAEVGMVFADPEAQFTAMTVEEEIVLGMENMGLPLQVIADRLASVSELTGIADLLEKSPYDISGGQKQRVAIASILAMNPRILILDEPTSMIDPVGKREIFEILRRLKTETALTLLVVEHNIEEMAPLADRLAVVADGRIARVGPPREILEDTLFLETLGIAAPEVSELFADLRLEGLYGGSLPLALEEAVRQGLTLLADGESRVR
jgi:energy-coupling factor transporter ATP-binding protein EcfA2